MSINFNKLFIQEILSRRESSHALDLNDEGLKITEESVYSGDDNEGDDDDDEYDSEQEDDNENSSGDEDYDDDDDGDDDVDDDIEEDNSPHMSDASNYADTEANKNTNHKSRAKINTGEHSQKRRLISALDNLRLAVDKQAKLQAVVNGYPSEDLPQDYSRTLKLHSVKEVSPNPDSVKQQTVVDSHPNPPPPQQSLNHHLELPLLNDKYESKRCTEVEDEHKGEETSDSTIKHDQMKSLHKQVKKQGQYTAITTTTDISVPIVDKEALAFRRNERLSKRKERVSVQIRVVFLKIGEIDTLKEIYHADAFIQAKWREPRLDGKTDECLRKIDLQRCWNPLILIDNILSESKEQHWIMTEKTENGEIYIVERRRLRGVFLETLELNDFPLDVQDLTITLTSERPESEVQLIPDKNEPCRINLQTLVDQQEWKLHEHIEITRRSATQEYTHSSQSHPCISVTCRAARRPGYFYWNVFLIMFFITGLSFATFAVPPERPENRLQLSFTLFLTSVAFKFVINQSLPKISYLTYMDKYVLMSLAILCVVSVWHAVVTLIPNDAEFEQLTTKNLLKSTDPQFSFMKRYKELTFANSAAFNRTSERTDNLGDVSIQKNISLLQKKPATSSNLAVSLENEGSSDAGKSSRLSQQLSQQTWIALALQSKNHEQQKRRLMMRIERDVFVSFCVLYVLAHLTFIFWLYFDASRRRREMVERDRLYKKCLQASKAL
uniref:Neur_chan_LBD domain-containing protein n=1 Tax=Trichobilharzia regenti TaxID=157069 RepID=A0AA85K2U2_TRIRE|nr:unnamed protein product [Trichobilharzia regenti]